MKNLQSISIIPSCAFFSPQWIQQLILSHYKASSEEEPVELLDHDRIGWGAGWHWATGTTHLVHQASTWWTTSGVAPGGLQERALASMHRPPAWSPGTCYLIILTMFLALEKRHLLALMEIASKCSGLQDLPYRVTPYPQILAK